MQRLLPAEFSEMICEHAKDIFTAHETLQTINSLLYSDQWIKPHSFEFPIQSLMDIIEESRKFHALIEQSGHLPLVIVPLRLPLLIALKEIDAKVSKIIRLVASLLDMISLTQYQPVEQKLEIQCIIRGAQFDCKEVLEQVEILQRNLRDEIDKRRSGRLLYSVV